jgi:hypothetical protein
MKIGIEINKGRYVLECHERDRGKGREAGKRKRKPDTANVSQQQS